MGRGVIFLSFLFFALGAAVVHGFPMNDLITKLPGQPDVTFRQFAGYIDVDVNAGRSVFYYFVEAEKDPMNKPLTIWLTGGPGCSSAGDSFASVGPFVTTNNARGLRRNLFSWNKVSNLLFIDMPIGAGWSYSNTSSDEHTNGDESTNKNLIAFLQKWYEEYPDFKSRNLYIAGSSYGGHFVSNLASSLLDYNKQSRTSIFNLKGVALGNPMLRRKIDIMARIELFFSRGMINSELNKKIEKECNVLDEKNYLPNIATSWTPSCAQLLTNDAVKVAFKTDDTKDANGRLFDVLRDLCTASVKDLEAGKEVSLISYDVEMCNSVRVEFYFNLPEVQKAFHGNRTNLDYPWVGCARNTHFDYIEKDKDLDMLPKLQNVLQHNIPVTIFSGDQDGLIPTTGTLKHLHKLAEMLSFKLTTDAAWSHDNKEGGWKYQYGGTLLTLVTVKGGNHHVTLSRPSHALAIFTDLINRAH
ncbi:hypothetical protein PTKIN_Ptkin18bG0058400 [Pterospermum kingtungense]